MSLKRPSSIAKLDNNIMKGSKAVSNGSSITRSQSGGRESFKKSTTIKDTTKKNYDSFKMKGYYMKRGKEANLLELFEKYLNSDTPCDVSLIADSMLSSQSSFQQPSSFLKQQKSMILISSPNIKSSPPPLDTNSYLSRTLTLSSPLPSPVAAAPLLLQVEQPLPLASLQNLFSLPVLGILLSSLPRLEGGLVGVGGSVECLYIGAPISSSSVCPGLLFSSSARPELLYEGTFKGGVFHGTGTLFNCDSRTKPYWSYIKGHWRHAQLHGVCYIDAEWGEIHAEWEDGVLQGLLYAKEKEGGEGRGRKVCAVVKNGVQVEML